MGLRHIGIVIFFLFATASLNAEDNPELDSILNRLPSQKQDTVKIYMYGRVSRLYFLMRDQTELARKYADSMLWLSEKLCFEEGKISARFRYAEIEQFKGNYRDAIGHFKEYLTFFEHKRDSFRMTNVLFGIGKCYKSLGDFDESLKYFYRAIKISELTNDQEGAALAWNSVSGIYRQIGEYEKAIIHYKKANEIYRMLGRTKNYAMGLQNLANVYSTIERYDTARLLYEEALTSIRKIDEKYEKAIILGSLGKLHDRLNEYKTALSYHLQALAIRKTLPNKRSLAFGLLYVGETHFKLKNYSEAEKYLFDGLELAQEIRSKDLIFEAYRMQSEVAAAKGNFKQAYDLSKLFNQWKDSVFNETTASQINELQARYETEKKDQQIRLLSVENEMREKEAKYQSTVTNAVVVGFLVVVVIAALVVYVSRQKLKNQKLIAAKDNEIKEANFKRQMSELEMKALRAQINPHFLFNCMNSINRMILEGENENASIYLAKFSKLVRLILENAEGSAVSLQSELTLLESYIQLEGLRFKGKINYKITVDESIDPHALYLPSMVLQPFVENAIWHGLMHKNGRDMGMVEITVTERNGRLLCAIEDNGVGRERARQLAEKSVLKTKSMGLKITEERLRLLSREDWEKLINIVDLRDSLNQAAGTRVEITIPVS